MTEVRQLTVLGRFGYHSIPTVTEFVAEAASAAGLGEDDIFQCQMAVDEACTNIIEHAYDAENVGDIEITCFVEPGMCTVQLVDHGKPFDPETVPQPQAPSSIDELKPGGLGLHLMRKLMDEIHFSFNARGNTLTMVKSRSSKVGWAQSSAIPAREIQPGIWLVEPQGRLDAATVPRLEDRLTQLLQGGDVWLVINMGQVTYISSRGLKALISAWRTARDSGGDVLLCSMLPLVWSLFETIGFTQVFDVHGTLEDALAAVNSQRD